MGLWDVIFTALGFYGISKRKNEFINYVKYNHNKTVQHWVNIISYICNCHTHNPYSHWGW
jgi:hypothetical protein